MANTAEPATREQIESAQYLNKELWFIAQDGDGTVRSISAVPDAMTPEGIWFGSDYRRHGEVYVDDPLLKASGKEEAA